MSSHSVSTRSSTARSQARIAVCARAFTPNMRIALVVLVAACSAEPAATHPVAPEPARAPVVANTAPAAAAIPGTTGTCEADPKVDGVDDNRRPVAIAGCPAPMDMSRGNGFSSDPYPTVTPGPLPAWDLAGTLAYACAYACAPA